MKKIFNLVLLTVAVLGFSAITMPSAVSAATAHCGSERFCIFDGTGFSGSAWALTLPPLGSCKNLFDLNNAASSMANGSTAYDVIAYDLPNCGGSWIYAANGQEYPSLGSMNNRISSFKKVTAPE
jgi:pimeloyl-ACP methyl ester carboxylesterase